MLSHPCFAPVYGAFRRELVFRRPLPFSLDLFKQNACRFRSIFRHGAFYLNSIFSFIHVSKICTQNWFMWRKKCDFCSKYVSPVFFPNFDRLCLESRSLDLIEQYLVLQEIYHRFKCTQLVCAICRFKKVTTPERTPTTVSPVFVKNTLFLI